MGKWLGLSALAVPFGAAILSALDYGRFVMPWSAISGEPSWFFFLGVFFSLLPLGVILYWWQYGEEEKENPGKKDWSVIQGSTLENYTQDITEESERSSVEFEDYFYRIIDALLEDGDYSRVVIVIDNLDRVESKTAKSIWSALQTFFQHKNSYSSIDTSKLWFLIPHDKKGLSSIWSNDDENKDEVSQSFIEKSIQLTVDVPSPAFSSWSRYLENLVNESLYGWEKDDQNMIVSVFKRYENTIGVMPTPRHLRRYINQVGTTAIRWGGIVGMESISLYALLKFEYCNSDLQEQLLKKDLPKRYKCLASDLDVKQDLAGMVLGVEPSKGMELLLGGELEEAIRGGNREKVENLINDHPEAIVSICHAVLPTLLPQSSHTEEYSLNFSVAIVALLKKFKGALLPETRRFQEYWLDAHTKWNFEGYDYSLVIDNLYELEADWSGFDRIRDHIFIPVFKESIKKVGEEKFSSSALINLDVL